MELKVIGFLSNKLTLRGTEIAMYDYAEFNETLLNNKSIIISRDYNSIKGEFDVSEDAYKKFKNRFNVEYYINQSDIDDIVVKNGITHLYIIKAGNWDGLISTKCKNLIHCVFTSNTPHGQVYSTISHDVNRICGTNFPVVPHMIRVYDTNDNMRSELNIPDEAIVFGRYGGVETFDIKFVYNSIKEILNKRNDIYFIFMNTSNFYTHKNIIYLNGTTDMYIKRKFINTTDALLHAREGGETFGLTCGEFAVCLKPVITYNPSRERNHIDILQNHAILYNNFEELNKILSEFYKNKYNMNDNGYLQYTPENIMSIFNNVYLTDF
jgi:hypothetical protein